MYSHTTIRTWFLPRELVFHNSEARPGFKEKGVFYPLLSNTQPTSLGPNGGRHGQAADPPSHHVMYNWRYVLRYIHAVLAPKPDGLSVRNFVSLA